MNCKKNKSKKKEKKCKKEKKGKKRKNIFRSNTIYIKTKKV